MEKSGSQERRKLWKRDCRHCVQSVGNINADSRQLTHTRRAFQSRTDQVSAILNRKGAVMNTADQNLPTFLKCNEG